MRKITLLGVLVLLLLSGCSSNDTKDQFIVGMECGYAPYNWTETTPTDGSVQIDGGQYCNGYDVQIAQRVANTMGKELVIKKTTWEGLILSLQANQIDAIIAGMSPTQERKQEISFSNIYYRDDAVNFGVVVKREGPYANVDSVKEFKDAKIAAQIGTHHMQLLTQLEGVDALENYKDFPTMTVALQANEMDGFIADNGTGEMINNSNPDLKFVLLDGTDGFVVTDEMAGVAIGINKNNTELLEQVNVALAEISPEEQTQLMQAAIDSGEFTSGNFFQEVWTILTNNYQYFWSGTLTTLLVSLSATVIGFFIALLVATTRNNKIANFFSSIYIAVFRGTPMMVQAMVIFYGTAMLIPGFNWSNLPNGNILAGIIIVSINTGAYLAETIRSGIQSIDKGQFEAAKSLGFTHGQTMRYIILPQAIKNVIPALGNELIVNVKDTSVLNVIAVTELFFVSNGIAATTYKIFQTFTITSAIYLFLTMTLSFILRRVEKKLDSDSTTSYPASVTDGNIL